MLRHLLFFCTTAFIAAAASSQPLQYKFTRLNANNGLSANQITCFLRDSHGFIWIGTTSGLNRYDGYSVFFRTFQ